MKTVLKMEMFFTKIKFKINDVEIDVKQLVK